MIIYSHITVISVSKLKTCWYLQPLFDIRFFQKQRFVCQSIPCAHISYKLYNITCFYSRELHVEVNYFLGKVTSCFLSKHLPATSNAQGIAICCRPKIFLGYYHIVQMPMSIFIIPKSSRPNESVSVAILMQAPYS